MSEHIVILTIALVVLFYGYISKALANFNISGPMVFTGLGLLISPLGLDVSDVNIDAEFVTLIAEIALVLVLFSDAALLDLKLLRQSWQLPTRLLLLGLPLMIVFGTIVAQFIFPTEPTLHLLLLALLLAPTDAALGKAVVTDTQVPKTIRSTINVESGLNDGIVFPVVITVVAMITSGLTNAADTSWIGFVIKQVGFGALVGAGIGYAGAKLSLLSVNKSWMTENYQNLIPIALAIIAFYLAEAIGGNGFIAAFFAGLYAGNTSSKTREHIEDFAESEGELLVLISFFVFGVAFIPALYDYVTFEVCVYAILSLTLIRMIPAMFCLLGVKVNGVRIDISTMGFIAWFGPRGIASILYALIVTKEIGTIEGFETVYAVVMVTVVLSIIAHGLSAQPLANRYGNKHKKVL
ncbi:cation:proton antiporter [Thalassotalea crassostreae]|uniref:cation:proton antiporter n=1 Tax=Thalassotalea crassostreae TaxID=1763536 RepID=UPI000837C756|nr:cation:proton antiporter [Thalassotalea crassostreae]